MNLVVDAGWDIASTWAQFGGVRAAPGAAGRRRLLRAANRRKHVPGHGVSPGSQAAAAGVPASFATASRAEFRAPPRIPIGSARNRPTRSMAPRRERDARASRHAGARRGRHSTVRARRVSCSSRNHGRGRSARSIEAAAPERSKCKASTAMPSAGCATARTSRAASLRLKCGVKRVKLDLRREPPNLWASSQRVAKTNRRGIIHRDRRRCGQRVARAESAAASKKGPNADASGHRNEACTARVRRPLEPGVAPACERFTTQHRIDEQRCGIAARLSVQEPSAPDVFESGICSGANHVRRRELGTV